MNKKIFIGIFAILLLFAGITTHLSYTPRIYISKGHPSSSNEKYCEHVGVVIIDRSPLGTAKSIDRNLKELADKTM